MLAENLLSSLPCPFWAKVLLSSIFSKETPVKTAAKKENKRGSQPRSESFFLQVGKGRASAEITNPPTRKLQDKPLHRDESFFAKNGKEESPCHDCRGSTVKGKGVTLPPRSEFFCWERKWAKYPLRSKYFHWECKRKKERGPENKKWKNESTPLRLYCLSAKIEKGALCQEKNLFCEDWKREEHLPRLWVFAKKKGKERRLHAQSVKVLYNNKWGTRHNRQGMARRISELAKMESKCSMVG